MDTLSLSSVLKTDEYINDHCLLGMQINFLPLFSPLSTLLLAPNTISHGSLSATETFFFLPIYSSTFSVAWWRRKAAGYECLWEVVLQLNYNFAAPEHPTYSPKYWF